MELAQQQRWCLKTMEDISLSQLYTEISEGVQQSHGEDTPTTLIKWPCNRLGAQLQFVYGRIWNSSELSMLSRVVFTQLRGIRLCTQEARLWIWTSRSDVIWTDRWVGSILWWTTYHRIIGLQWRVNKRRTLWRSVTMTSRESTELQERSRNAVHTSAIMHRAERNS